jgi:hypothetical protein
MFKSNLLIFTICVTLLLIGSAFFYRYVIYLPEIQKEKVKQSELKQEKYNECIEQAYSEYHKAWDLRCSEQFKIVLEQNTQCTYDLINKGVSEKDAREQCYSDYPMGNYSVECKSLPTDRVEDIRKDFDKNKTYCSKFL